MSQEVPPFGPPFYVFVSFGSAHTGKNLGCCIVQVDDYEQANEECKRLGLMPNECNHAKGFVMDEAGFKAQGMELNRRYSAAEMAAMGFEKATCKVKR